VEELGLEPSELSADLLHTRVEEVAASEEIRGHLAKMSKIMREAGGAVAAADAIEAFVAD
jgi:UDP:flavonoid glycosyltransferase YjiC (YdhE family)